MSIRDFIETYSAPHPGPHFMIRPATPADLAAVTACAREAYTKYVERIGREPAPMVADFAGQIADGILHVAVGDDGTIDGFIVFYPREDHMHLENVAVANHAQGQGVGRALIAACEAAARDAGFERVELYTNEKMTENLTLYPHLGYVEAGRWREDGFDRVFYRKTLAQGPGAV
jgi:ribosomal protein S18 acetylase RimI-like enzyme